MDWTRWEGRRGKTRVVRHLGNDEHGCGEDVFVACDGIAVFARVDEVLELGLHERNVHALVELGSMHIPIIPFRRS